jgi:hypothetical protein
MTPHFIAENEAVLAIAIKLLALVHMCFVMVGICEWERAMSPLWFPADVTAVILNARTVQIASFRKWAIAACILEYAAVVLVLEQREKLIVAEVSWTAGSALLAAST